MTASTRPEPLPPPAAAVGAESSTLAARLAARLPQHAAERRVLPESSRADALIDFCSNDYLGLAQDPVTAATLARAASDSGSGAGSSPLIDGRRPVHEALEQRISTWLGTEATILFSAGYAANVGVITALVAADEEVHADRHIHASLIDGVRLAGARLRRFPHLDYEALEARLARPSRRARWLVSDGVFSMEGDTADPTRLMALAARFDTPLILDDAHGLGVIGPRGLGVLGAVPGRGAELAAVVGTFGKAFGLSGAFVSGPAPAIDTLVNRARSYVYSTGLSPAIAGAVLALWPEVVECDARRTRLAQNLARFRRGAARSGLPFSPSVTPIQGLRVGDPAVALTLSDALATRGFRVRAIRAPTVPAGTERLRITISARHRAEDIDGLLAAIADATNEVPLP